MSLIRMRRKMQTAVRPLMIVILIVFVVSIFATAGMNPGPSDAGGGGEAFARIAGQDVPVSEFRGALRQTQQMQQGFGGMGSQVTSIQQRAEFPVYAYQSVLQQRSEAAAAERAGVNVSLADAENEVRRRVDAQLEQQGAGLKPEEIQEYREKLIAYADLEAERRQLLSQRLREKLSTEARPVEVKVAHVLIKTDTRSEDAARRIAEDVARQARAGGDFAKLAREKSEDLGSKNAGGEVGWASAQPPAPSADPKAKKSPDDATQFVPEFTAAALRLKPGEVSDPVKSQFGYHVLKALQERPFEPKEADVKKDPKKRQDAIDAYKSAVGSQIADGLFAEAKARIEGTVEARSEWLKGYLAEQKAKALPSPTGPDSKPADPSQQYAEAIRHYEAAMKAGGPEADAGLAWKLVQLYQETKQDAKALDMLKTWAERSREAELYFALGEALEKGKKKTEALDAYKKALEGYNNGPVLLRLADKFKTLGRPELAKQARAEQTEQTAREAADRARQQALIQRMIAEQTAKQKPAAVTPGAGGTASTPTVQVTTKDPAASGDRKDGGKNTGGAPKETPAAP